MTTNTDATPVPLTPEQVKKLETDVDEAVLNGIDGGAGMALALQLFIKPLAVTIKAREATIASRDAEIAALRAPVDMLLFCPRCDAQHVDTAEGTWANPPHKSHLCHACRAVWRPSDRETNGVATIATVGKGDTFSYKPAPVTEGHVEAARSVVCKHAAPNKVIMPKNNYNALVNEIAALLASGARAPTAESTPPQPPDDKQQKFLADYAMRKNLERLVESVRPASAGGGYSSQSVGAAVDGIMVILRNTAQEAVRGERERLQRLSDAVSNFMVSMGSVYPGLSREEGERQHYASLQQAMNTYGLPQIPVRAIRGDT